ncbi:MAG: type IV pilin protein [Gammaproteobacteria bacterium]|nr:type IV pilin protein [Gammaproteobacteria bacterium]
MKKHNGFTLLELMIVVVIIGILSAIAYPSYSEYIKQARLEDAQTGLLVLASRQERFYRDTYTTSFTDLNYSSTSEDGYFEFKITSDDLLSGYLLTATSESAEIDEGCWTMTLSSTGAKTPKDCW